MNTEWVVEFGDFAPENAEYGCESLAEARKYVRENLFSGTPYRIFRVTLVEHGVVPL